MNIPFLGELTALATSVCFTIGSIYFTVASRRLGAVILNRTRLVIAWIFLALSHWVVVGSLFPTQAGWHEWIWLGASGIVGLALGDIFLFDGFSTIGPRLTMLMMSLSPILTTLLAWLFFDEVLTPMQLLGIGVTIGGIVWVVLEHNQQQANQVKNDNLMRGLAAGLGAAACQSIGLILARQGLGESFSPLSGNYIRMVSAMVIMWTAAFFMGQAGSTFRALQSNPKAVLFAVVGAFLGPFLGVSLSLVAVQILEVGIVSTLMSLPPVLLLPISFFVFKERIGPAAVLGTLAALGGIAILFLA